MRLAIPTDLGDEVVVMNLTLLSSPPQKFLLLHRSLRCLLFQDGTLYADFLSLHLKLFCFASICLASSCFTSAMRLAFSADFFASASLYFISTSARALIMALSSAAALSSCSATR